MLPIEASADGNDPIVRPTIPTRHKSKLAHTMTWPIGAEAITAGLGDAPHAAELALWFYDSAVWPASKFQHILRDALPYAVLVAMYQPDTAPVLIAPWRLTVHPVLRPVRSTVNALLRQSGLPAVTDWLRSSDKPGWIDRGHQLKLLWSPAAGTLAMQTRDYI